MNSAQLDKLFQNYIEKFDDFSFGEHDETYKWEIVQDFQDHFDINSPEFPEMLDNLRKNSENLIDNRTQLPFTALVDYARREPETVRQLFTALFAEDNGDLVERQAKITRFIKGTEDLRKKYYPDSWRYENDQRSAMAYLFLYDPDHNYLYKPTQAHEFADCVDFYDDIGSGAGFKLPVYYRMCDELVSEMKDCKELLAVNETRFEDGRNLYPDKMLHILCFDMIYSSQVYGLYNGIEYSHLTAAERKQRKEEEFAKAAIVSKYYAAQKDLDQLNSVKAYLNSIVHIGDEVKHKAYGAGRILAISNGFLRIQFPDPAGTKNFELLSGLAGGFITLPVEGLGDYVRDNARIIKNASDIPRIFAKIKDELSPYKDQLDVK